MMLLMFGNIHLIMLLVDSHCPWREKLVKQITQAPWMTMIHIRDHLLKIARRTDHPDDWANYRVAPAVGQARILQQLI